MTPETGGRHCAACAKTVTDFTRMTDAQILKVLQNNPNACGRFWPHQLNRTLVEPPNQKRFSFATFYKMAASLLLLSSAGKVAATEKPLFTQEAAPHPSQWDSTIEGTVKDLNGQPITGATVEILGTTLKVVTDPDGFFLFHLRDRMDKVNLAFSYTGYVTTYIEKIILVAEQTTTVNSVLHTCSKEDSLLIRKGVKPTTTHVYSRPLINEPKLIQGMPLMPKEIEKMVVQEVEANTGSAKKWWQFWKTK